jgi:hypothetical protein
VQAACKLAGFLTNVCAAALALACAQQAAAGACWHSQCDAHSCTVIAAQGLGFTAFISPLGGTLLNKGKLCVGLFALVAIVHSIRCGQVLPQTWHWGSCCHAKHI